MKPSLFPALPGLCLAAALLAGCGEDAPPPAEPAPAASSPATPAPAPAASTPAPASSAPAAPEPIKVVGLTLGTSVGKDHHINQAATRFQPDDKTLYASVVTTGHADEATIKAQWRYLEGHERLVTSVSQTLASDGMAITTFKLENPDLWPEGRYRVDISLDDKPVAQREFVIGKE